MIPSWEVTRDLVNKIVEDNKPKAVVSIRVSAKATDVCLAMPDGDIQDWRKDHQGLKRVV